MLHYRCFDYGKKKPGGRKRTFVSHLRMVFMGGHWLIGNVENGRRGSRTKEHFGDFCPLVESETDQRRAEVD
jgi:hypothetical protein